MEFSRSGANKQFLHTTCPIVKLVGSTLCSLSTIHNVPVVNSIQSDNSDTELARHLFMDFTFLTDADVWVK